ncbi:DUF2628 domain-containing protein [Cronobacter malonaticus]|uniref:DUF2628 domain-containing protein n=1 Tax=Cronobacter malonaticus TaxID=413503 RepID=UPI0005185AA3|nr:DUF2628 domain-containing protein [Cronobacter malonaticus]EMD9275149.1 DUF2628 domain-containing protein [Cronobacter malonaticus]KIU62314.1 hypothetical protein CRSA0334_13380 [Cronobacter malonaticus ENBT0334]
MSNMENDKKHYDYMADPKLSDKWKFRFKFIEDNGYPAVLVPTPAWREALKKLSIMERLKVSLNFITYFFSFIYLAILGLWKKSILCVLAIFVVAIISNLLNIRALMYIVPFYFACHTNVWYYDLKVKGKQDWSL